MSKEEICENSRLILEFMEYTKDIYSHGRNGSVDIWKNDSVRKGHYRTLLECNFHYDWNELMPVVDKIVNHINVNKITWLTRQEIFGNLYSAISTVNLNNIYLATTEFIKWYNQNKLNETN